MAGEFLPLCDVLFNVISLAGYFCDVVFDVVMCYALLERGRAGAAAAALSIIASSLLISQVVSLRWYLHIDSGVVEGGDAGAKKRSYTRYIPHILHFFQLGVLWRYAKLFVPVDLRYVKHEVRNLCMLRLVHAFCEAAPMLLLQLHVLAEGLTDPSLNSIQPTTPSSRPVLTVDRGASAAFAELNIISASLSLFSVCWALASFSKNVRLQNVHRLVLTWLGVIFQFAWRLGTISARVIALTVYATIYEHWVFLVIGLHWVSMFLWLISPKNVFHGERISKPRKAYLSALIAFVYVFAYVNLQEVNHRQKMVTFYLVMLVENCLLVCLWVAGVLNRDGAAAGMRLLSLPMLVLACFFAGIAFMLVYYRYFHVRRLGYELGGRLPPMQTNSMDNKIGTEQYGCYDGPAGHFVSGDNHLSSKGLYNCSNGVGERQYQRNPIPGVFNCRFSNPVGGNATKRKKKKPTSFIPPPAAPPAPLRAPRPAPLPFWRRPLPAPHTHSHCGSSENEGSSVGSRVNIHQKLQEKKQKQLAELKIIEEEIKQGKLANNGMISGEEIYCSLQRQPIPRTKKHIDLEPLTWAPPTPELASLGQSFENLNTLSQNNCEQSQKLFDALTSSSLSNPNSHGGYENFDSFTQNALAASNLGQFLGSFPSYTEIPSLGKNSNTISPINIPANYESVSGNNRNMSPSSQVSNGDQNNSLTRQILPRGKNHRQFITSSVHNRQYPCDRQLKDQSRLVYVDSNSPRTVLQNHQNSSSLPSDNNCRLQRNYQDGTPVQRVANFTPTVDSRGNSYENSKSVSPRNVENMNARTPYTNGTGSATNSYERSTNRFIDNMSPRQMSHSNSSGHNSSMFGDNAHIQHSGVFSLANQDSVSHLFSESRQDPLTKSSADYRDLRYNFLAEMKMNCKHDNMMNSHNCDGGNQRYIPTINGTGAGDMSNLGFPYPAVSAPKAKLDRNGGNHIAEQTRKMQRCKTPEILLAPHFLENTSRQNCCHWVMPYRGQHDTDCCQTPGEILSSGAEGDDLPCRPSSDLDSQISLPRSYTLPREFKYYRRNRQRRLLRLDNFVASTNSSDGDVDSGDDNESERLSNNSTTYNQTKESNNASQTAQPSQQQGNQTIPTSQHQHSISQPSSSRFTDFQDTFAHSTAVREQPLSTQNVCAYNKIEAGNNFSSNDDRLDSKLDNGYSEDSFKHPSTGSPADFSQKNNYNNSSGIGADHQTFHSGVSPAHGRQLRNRTHGINKLGMVKHETKL